VVKGSRLSPRTQAPASLDSPSYWRRLLATVHPDRGGDHELFLFLQALKEHVGECGGGSVSELCSSRHRDRHGHHDRVPYDEALGFVDEHTMLTHRALSIAETVQEPFCGVLRLVVDFYLPRRAWQTSIEAV
jgi:hypothetical protein